MSEHSHCALLRIFLYFHQKGEGVMRITWKDGITTFATAGAIVLERAHFHNWDWPLVSNVRWVVAGLALLIAINLVFGYVLDSQRSTAWSWTAGVLAIVGATLAVLGMIYVNADFAVLLMLTAVVTWAASLVAHLAANASHTHTFA